LATHAHKVFAWRNEAVSPADGAAPVKEAGTAPRARLDTSTPVILLGGRENTLAVVRNLGSLGVPIYVSGRAGCRAIHSRYCRTAFAVPGRETADAFWRDLLLTSPRPELAGAVLLSNCDESMEFIAAHGEDLARHYRMEQFRPELRTAMLNKLETLKLARAAGVPTPQFWEVAAPADVLALRDEIRLPVMVKPLDSARFAEEFGRKLFIVENTLEEVADKVAFCQNRGHAAMVVEMIPGADDLLSSFYTYRTPDGRFLYDYTKSIIRRWPVNRGGACYHQSQWLPETAEMGRRLFEAVGWQGLGNVEFKRDTRDGQLKIIEVNGRFTAAHRLVVEAGAPIDLAVYCHLTGQEVPSFGPSRQPLRMWYPCHDFLAFLELRRAGKITFGRWIHSLRGQRAVLPYLSWRDPIPWLENMVFGTARLARRPLASLRKAFPIRG
jgi:predicted ATP-grasp superfamily ATP-dependent carboligase